MISSLQYVEVAIALAKNRERITYAQEVVKRLNEEKSNEVQTKPSNLK